MQQALVDCFRMPLPPLDYFIIDNVFAVFLSLSLSFAFGSFASNVIDWQHHRFPSSKFTLEPNRTKYEIDVL